MHPKPSHDLSEYDLSGDAAVALRHGVMHALFREHHRRRRHFDRHIDADECPKMHARPGRSPESLAFPSTSRLVA